MDINIKKGYIRRANAKLDQWSREIFILSDKIVQTKNQDCTEHKNRIDTLLDKRIAVRRKLIELENTGENDWKNMKSEIEVVLKEINKKITVVKSCFK